MQQLDFATAQLHSIEHLQRSRPIDHMVEHVQMSLV